KLAALKNEIDSLDEDGNEPSDGGAATTDGVGSAPAQAVGATPIPGDSTAPLPVAADGTTTAATA
ncbi:MAG: hypothetical protein ACTHLZ_18730, partial [Tepidisphaeraceae bacterium]